MCYCSLHNVNVTVRSSIADRHCSSMWVMVCVYLMCCCIAVNVYNMFNIEHVSIESKNDYPRVYCHHDCCRRRPVVSVGVVCWRELHETGDLWCRLYSPNANFSDHCQMLHKTSWLQSARVPRVWNKIYVLQLMFWHFILPPNHFCMVRVNGDSGVYVRVFIYVCMQVYACVSAVAMIANTLPSVVSTSMFLQ